MNIRCLAALAVAAAVVVVQAGTPGSKDPGLHLGTADPGLQSPPPLYLDPAADVVFGVAVCHGVWNRQPWHEILDGQDSWIHSSC